MNTLDLALHKVKLKKVSGTKGGEWQGPCPACGGVDRFHAWPNQNDGRGSYWCRSCEKAGDNIQFLRDFEGLSFKEACDKLNITIPESPARCRFEPKQTGKPEFTPDKHIPPADIWQEKAEKLIQSSRDNLAKNSETLFWLSNRGIGRETAENFRLGWIPGEDGKDIYRARKAWGLPEILKEDGKPRALWIPRGLIIPYIIDGIIHRIRIRRPEGEPRYYVIPGSSMATMIIERARRAFVVVESELDAITVAAHNNLAGAVALGSVSAKPDAETYGILQDALQILVAIDYDDAGAKAMKWWQEQFDRCDRWPVPQGKDPGDAYKLGIDLDQWIKTGLLPVLTMNDPAPVKIQKPEIRHSEPVVRHEAPENLSAPILELYDLLCRNPGVIIYNTPNRFTVLRNGKYVGGRINELVFRTPDVTAYILNHPAEEIDGSNFIE